MREGSPRISAEQGGATRVRGASTIMVWLGYLSVPRGIVEIITTEGQLAWRGFASGFFTVYLHSAELMEDGNAIKVVGSTGTRGREYVEYKAAVVTMGF